MTPSKHVGHTLHHHQQSPVRAGLTLLELAVMLAIIIICIALFLPAMRQPREAARRSQCKNNLKQIALALHNYHDEYNSFPPAYTVNAEGNPLHSWRTLILPFMDQQSLYEKIDLTKPWDDSVNAELLKNAPISYACPSAQMERHRTTYLAVTGENAIFHLTNTHKLAEIIDGTATTLMIIEVSPQEAVHWAAPQDADLQVILRSLHNPKTSHTSGVHAAFADGSERFISSQVSHDTIRGAISISGGEKIEL